MISSWSPGHLLRLQAVISSSQGCPYAPACQYLFPSWDKVEGLPTCLSFLIIKTDTTTWQLRLPQDRLTTLLSDLRTWSTSKKRTKCQLQSPIGKISFATKVIPAGKILLRQLITLSTSVVPLHHRITLNSEARADIHRWITFLPYWNGTAPILVPLWTPSTMLQLFTDASSLNGFGTFYQGAWFHDS